jgi:alkylresorcinol/alkylpyrone synthase
MGRPCQGVPSLRDRAPSIVSAATAVPAHRASQEEVKDVLRAHWPLDARRMAAALALFDHAAVEQRFGVEPFAALVGRPRSLTEISARYRQEAIALGREVTTRCLRDGGCRADEIDLLITVSCTGFLIPSLDAYLAGELGFRPDVRRLPITELGCSGGAAALARGRDFLVGFPGARVLIVAVELPSLNLQRDDLSPANIVSTALFGDGAAAVLLVGADHPAAATRVRVLDSLSHLFPRTTWALGFDLDADGFHSVLSRDVPALLKGELAGLVDKLATRNGLARAQLSGFVLHPGGRKILGVSEEALGLRREDTQLSWDVLREYGNQSSASVLFVLHRWLSERPPAAAPGAYAVLAAFGPGLTVELLLLQWT